MMGIQCREQVREHILNVTTFKMNPIMYALRVLI